MIMQIHIKNLRLRAIIGVNDWERDLARDVVVNVMMDSPELRFGPERSEGISSQNVKDEGVVFCFLDLQRLSETPVSYARKRRG